MLYHVLINAKRNIEQEAQGSYLSLEQERLR